jgi:hypothetical protein
MQIFRFKSRNFSKFGRLSELLRGDAFRIARIAAAFCGDRFCVRPSLNPLRELVRTGRRVRTENGFIQTVPGQAALARVPAFFESSCRLSGGPKTRVVRVGSDQMRLRLRRSGSGPFVNFGRHLSFVSNLEN